MDTYDWIDPFEEISKASREGYARGQIAGRNYVLDTIARGSHGIADELVRTVIVPAMLDRVGEVSGEVARAVAGWTFDHAPPKLLNHPITNQATIEVHLVKPFRYFYPIPVRRT